MYYIEFFCIYTFHVFFGQCLYNPLGTYSMKRFRVSMPLYAKIILVLELMPQLGVSQEEQTSLAIIIQCVRI